jgi:hypothetical protein
VAGIVNVIVVGTVNDQQAQVTVNGAPAQVANRAFLATDVSLALGSNVIQAVGRDRVGNAATTQITVTRQALSQQAQIRLISGNNQTGMIGSVLPAPLVVALTDATGNPVANRSVIVKVTQNDGMVAAGGPPAPSVIATTNAQGQAQVQWTLGMRAGAGANAVEAYAVGFAGTAMFTATGTQGPAGKIVVDSGNDQISAIDQPLPRPLIAVVVDSGNNRLAGVPVTFTVMQGGGSIEGQSSLSGAPVAFTVSSAVAASLASVTVNTDADGRAAVTWTLGPQAGNANNLVQADFPSNQGFPASFTASGRVPGDSAQTTIAGVVLDNSNVPIPGVTIRAVLTNVLNSNASAIQSVAAVPTDAQGQFAIPQAPVGFVKLVVDGSTAQLPGQYPSLEYDLVTVAGQNNTVGMPIYLLPLNTANQLCVTAITGGGTLTIPEAPGFSLTFGPGQVTFPGGSKNGCVSVTVVHGDKVPMVPGFGQQPRFIVTIQPAGAVFNPPAPITLPNVDGLKPREVTEMYSFDHDISSFVAIGTGVVSDDGQVIRSSAGVGVLKAGWHCGGNPQARGTVADCPPCNWCQGVSGASDQCVFDPAQGGKTCNSVVNSPYNNCIKPNTGICIMDPIAPISLRGICKGGELLPNGEPCNAGGSQLAACDGVGHCIGTGNQCPSACNSIPSPNTCMIYGCNNATCTQTPDPDCQTQCIGQPAGTTCNAGGSASGACQSGQCVGNGPQCPASCNGSNCFNGFCVAPSCTGQSDGTSCNTAGSVPGMCQNGQCHGSGNQCPASCDGGSCSNGICSITAVFDPPSLNLLRGESRVFRVSVTPGNAASSLQFVASDPRVSVLVGLLGVGNTLNVTVKDTTSVGNQDIGPDSLSVVAQDDQKRGEAVIQMVKDFW